MNGTLNVFGIGEILWDLLPEGKQLGGAPANFAFHARQLGLQSAIISAVGADELGREIRRSINKSGILDYIDDVDKPTGTVSVKLDPNGIPEYIIHEEVAWDYISPSEAALEFARESHAVCFGSLAQRSETSFYSIQEVLKAVPSGALKVYDINLRQRFYNEKVILRSLERANVLKMNDEEILTFAGMFGLSGDEYEIMHQILRKFNLQLLALTKGVHGSWLLNKEEQSFLETPGVPVADTVGAGDSFTAALVAGLLKGRSLKEIHRSAVEVSAYVCTQKGATPELPQALR